MYTILKKYLNNTAMEDLETPQFIYFPKQTEENIEKYLEFEKNGIDILYAIKANNYEKLIDSFISKNFGFDVASREEIQYVLKKGADPNKISFSAPTKIKEDLQLASKAGIKYYAFDSEEEIKKIVDNTKNPILFARISTPNEDSIFDLSTAFGMNDRYYLYILKKAKKYNWNIKGLTFHVGSQNTSISSWKNSLNKISHLVEVSKHYGFDIEYMNLGGGIPVLYDSKVKEADYYISKIIKLAKNLNQKYKFKRIFVEPGRALSANTMALVTEIINIKPYKKPPIAVVDASVFRGLIEPLEHFEYPIYVADDLKSSTPPTKGKAFFKIGGCSCDGYDIIKKKVLLPKSIKVGDRLVILYAGAYTFVYENFHMKSFPNINSIDRI